MSSNRDYIARHIRTALVEDCPKIDVTTSACVDSSQNSKAVLIAKQDMVVSGMNIFSETMKAVDSKTKVFPALKDGQSAKKGAVLARISGRSAAILKAERVALNYLQRMSGIATLTARYVSATKGTKAKIFDTRKTTPTLRVFEKYAVTCGGGVNHRESLSDAPLIKENHIRASGCIANAVKKIRKLTKKPIILEVTNRDEILEGLAAGADILLLDNMTPAQVGRAVKLINERAVVEVSGGITVKTARAHALAGADRISVGALTHSAPACDLSLLFEGEPNVVV
ncbi:MAG: carboxylating nicotinate-nucleotide diphosphorylase [Nitrospinae bacterium]|nr:carboxylating nicotinate-nucleotide diphosphorylase [Nitrospinota bacterium]